MFADLVPFEWRGHVMGIRNALISITATIMTLISGQILQHIPFPTGYQIVFGIGFVGAAFSSSHLYHLAKIAGSEKHNVYRKLPEKKLDQKESGRHFSDEFSHLYHKGIQSLRLDVMHGPFIKIMALLFAWHLAQFSTIPCITPFIVNHLKISDQMIGIANGIFNMTVFFGSLKFSQIAGRYGNKNVTGIGIILLSVYPILTAFGIVPYIIANFVGGIAWSLVGGGLYNYLLENIPGNDRPPYMAWYNLVANAAILIGSLMGPAVGGVIGMSTALIIFGIFRFLSGVAILRWG
jgi:MFS family permease